MNQKKVLIHLGNKNYDMDKLESSLIALIDAGTIEPDFIMVSNSILLMNYCRSSKRKFMYYQNRKSFDHLILPSKPTKRQEILIKLAEDRGLPITILNCLEV